MALDVAQLSRLLDAPSPAVLTTYRADGTAVASPVWFAQVDQFLEVVIADGDVKLRHLQRRPDCALLVFEASPPFRAMRVEAAATLERDGVTRVRRAIARRYLGDESGDRFTDSLRSLARTGRIVVLGFTGGAIPEVKVNRLLLRNTEVIGAGWGEYVMSQGLTYGLEAGAAVNALADAGHVAPLVGARFPLEQVSDALELMDSRQATGKVVLEP